MIEAADTEDFFVFKPYGLKIIQGTLYLRCRYNVEYASNGKEGVAQYKNNPGKLMNKFSLSA